MSMFQTRCWATAAAVVVSIGWAGVSAAATLHVPGDFATIQACIDAAANGVDQCAVAPGTYHETINFLGKAITLRSSGGADVTTIDATGIGGSVVTCISGEGPDTVLDGFTITGGTGTDFFGNGSTFGGGMVNFVSSPTVTNCTFSGNTATSYGGGMYNASSRSTVTDCTFSGNTAGAGGGMYNSDSSPTVSGCTFSGNTATSYGGGMYNAYSTPTVSNCAFSGNTAARGGGMYNDHSNATVTNCTLSGNTGTDDGGGMFNDSSGPTVTNCTFRGNTGTYGGGGMANWFDSSPTLSNCTFSGNTAYLGGGMYNVGAGLMVTNCTFSGNTAYVGGGMYNENNSSPIVTNSTFSGNTATVGGGMYNRDNSPTVTDCTFSGNTAYVGGGMINYYSSPTVSKCTFSRNRSLGDGGGMENQYSDATIADCTFNGNAASAGGGMYNYASSPIVTNCTFRANTAYGGGGGMYNADASPTLIGCAFSGNTATFYGGGGGMFNNGSSPTVANSISWGDRADEIVNFDESAVPTIGFSDVQGGLPDGAIDGGGNIALDPMFVRAPNPGPDGMWGGVDDDYGDLRLQGGSSCIDAGDPAFVGQPGETDLEGHARVLCVRVDIGAYEFGIGDYDCDQTVNLNDFSVWSSCMTGPNATAVSAVPSHEATEPRSHEATKGQSTIDDRQSAARASTLTATGTWTCSTSAGSKGPSGRDSLSVFPLLTQPQRAGACGGGTRTNCRFAIPSRLRTSVDCRMELRGGRGKLDRLCRPSGACCWQVGQISQGFALDRNRGGPFGPTPPRPPCVGVRTRRFGWWCVPSWRVP